MVSFTHEDQRDKGLTYVTQVNYAVNAGAAGIVQPMSRHVINYEIGPHKGTKDYAAGYVLHLIAGQAMRDRHDKSLAAEQAMGLQDVTAEEAAQILQFLKDLKLAAE